MNTPSKSPATDEISLFELVSALWIRKWLISSLVIVSLILGYIHSTTKPQVYSAHSTLTLDESSYIKVALANALVFGGVNARHLRRPLFTSAISLLQNP